MPDGISTVFSEPPPSGSGPSSTGSPRGRPYFLWALLVVLAVYGLGFVLIRIPIAPAEPVRFPPVYVQFVGGTAAAADARALLFDSEPLFLPTAWNYASRPTPPPRVRPEPVFADYSIEVKPPSENGLRLAPAPTPGPIAALQPGQWNVLTAMGLGPAPAPKLSERGAFLRVTRLDAGAAAAPASVPAVIEETWAAADAPKSTQHLQALWGPATFLLLFSETGAVGEPLLVNSSGIYAVDDDLRARLDARFRRNPLPAGTYQAVIGP